MEENQVPTNMETPEVSSLSSEDIANVVDYLLGNTDAITNETTDENTTNESIDESTDEPANTEFEETQDDTIRVPEPIIPEIQNRFSGAEWFSEASRYTAAIIGCGGIGSWTALLLARCGINLDLVDHDRVEPTNLSGQLFSKWNFGLSKVESIASLIRNYTNSCVSEYLTRFDENMKYYQKTIMLSRDILICGLDNMKSREYVFNEWEQCCAQSNYTEKKLFIDGRLSANALQIYCVPSTDINCINQYKDSLFSDEEADATVCSFKQTSYMASMIGSLITNIVINYIASNIHNHKSFYDVPFYTEYNANTMQLKIK